MHRFKFTSVLLAAAMCLSLFMTPVLVSADETVPSETETTESSEPTETSQSEKFTVNRKESVRTVTGMCGDRAVWLLDNNGTLTVSGFGDMDNWETGDLVPWKNYKDSIRAVVISSGVTSVGERAFDGCLSLENVNIAESVVKIGDFAFSGCINLKSAVLDENLYKSSTGIFYGCPGVSVSYIASYPITVIGGTSDVSKACAGATVTLTVGDAPEGKTFDQWTVNMGEVEITTVDEKTATFVMPSGYVQITASFKDKEPQNNTLSVRGKKTKLKAKKLKKKSQKVARGKVMTVRNPRGRVTYKLLKVSKSGYKKYFKVNSKNGNVTVKKKLKKGTYTVRCLVWTSGNADYKSGSKVVSFKIIVK